MPSIVSCAGRWPFDDCPTSAALSKDPGEPVTTRRVFLGSLAGGLFAAPLTAEPFPAENLARDPQAAKAVAVSQALLALLKLPASQRCDPFLC